MAKYTMTIFDIMEQYAWTDDKELVTQTDLMEYGRKRLFNFAYPFYEPQLKDEFEQQFIRHFYNREIGSESLALFKMRLQDYLILNSEKWERLYKNLTDDINPFINYDVKIDRGIDEKEHNQKDNTRDDDKNKTYKENQKIDYSKTGNVTESNSDKLVSNEKTNSSGKSDSFKRTLTEDTPDGRLGITANDGKGVIDYASGIDETRDTENHSDNTTKDYTNDKDMKRKKDYTEKGNTNKDTKGDEQNTLKRLENELKDRELKHDLKERKIGKIGERSYTDMYVEYVENFETINRMIFKDMSKLFMGVLN